MELFETLTSRELADLARKDIDDLTIFQATELLVDYCLKDPEVESKSIASKMITGGLYIAVGMTRDERAGNDVTDKWIHRIRLSMDESPFASTTGIEIRIPYGIDAGIEDITPNSKKTGVFVSLENDHKYWSGVQLRHAQYRRSKDFWEGKYLRTFNLVTDTVREADLSLASLTKERQLAGLGFWFKDALRFIDESYVEMVKIQPENQYDISPPDNAI